MDRSKNLYTVIPAPPELDAALEHGIQSFNLRAPVYQGSEVVYQQVPNPETY
jgi:hypothetical protein